MGRDHVEDGDRLIVQPGGAVFVWSERLGGWAPKGTTPDEIEIMRAQAIARFGHPAPRVVEGKHHGN